MVADRADRDHKCTLTATGHPRGHRAPSRAQGTFAATRAPSRPHAHPRGASSRSAGLGPQVLLADRAVPRGPVAPVVLPRLGLALFLHPGTDRGPDVLL